MAFWGIEVKPGKPFTHKPDNGRGRLHLSQATLGIGSAMKNSVVQCNVGNRSPVFLCSLFPEKAESCQLNLEFEEDNEVVFSVIGPRSVHLTGYYLGSSRHCNPHDESESYGEDIADTETERSAEVREGSGDEYDDSFIDDGDPEVFPPSPLSSDKVAEAMLDKRKSKNNKGIRRRLRKKYHMNESDDEYIPRQETLVNGSIGGTVLDSENEDKFPISSLYKNNATSTSARSEAEENVEEGTCEISKKKMKDDVNNANAPERKTCAILVGPNRPKKKRKDQSKEGKLPEGEGEDFFFDNGLKWDKAQQSKNEAGKLGKHMPVINGEEQRTANKKGHDLSLSSLSSIQLLSGTVVKPKKKRKEWEKEDRSLDADSHFHANVMNNCDKPQPYEAVAQNAGHDMRVTNEENQKQANDGANQSTAENHSRKKGKEKKRNRIEENGEALHVEIPLSSMNKKSTSLVVDKNNAEDKSSHLRTLPNDLVIEDLEMGKSDGKIAVSGKKISVLYTGKLEKNGQVFDSNVDGAPFKFRLGSKEILEGWNVGLDGMRVGDKRRLIIPPSMGYGSEGDDKNVPPNSWLVYDVELLKVR